VSTFEPTEYRVPTNCCEWTARSRRLAVRHFKRYPIDLTGNRYRGSALAWGLPVDQWRSI